MRAKATAPGHGIRPMWIAFPRALLILTPVADQVGLIARDASALRAAFWLAFVGVILGGVAAIPELLAWLALPGRTRARRIGGTRLGVDAAALALFALSVMLRLRHGVGHFALVPFLPALLGAILLVAAGFGGARLARRTVAALRRRRYQPIGLPWSWRSSHGSSGAK